MNRDDPVFLPTVRVRLVTTSPPTPSAPSGDRDATAVWADRSQDIRSFGVFALDASGIVRSWNAGARQITGFDAEDIVGSHFSHLFTHEEKQAEQPALALAAATRDRVFETEGWRVRKDADLVWTQMVIEASRDESGGSPGFVVILRDGTQARLRRAETLAQETQFRLLVEGVTDYAIYMLDTQGRISNWNAGAQRAKGYTADEIVGRHFSCFYSVEDQAAVLPERNLVTALCEGTCTAEGWRIRKDGERFWAHVVIQPIHDDAGVVLGFTKITRDCSAQRAATLALQESSRNLDLALANTLQGLCLFDAQGCLTLSNRRFGEILDLTPSATLPGRRLKGIVRRILRGAEDLTATDRHRLGRLMRPDTRDVGETRGIEFGHASRALSLSTRILVHGGLLLTVEDITERRRSAQRIEHLARHDVLTGLPNRLDFQNQLQRVLADTSDRSRFALLYLDLDRFKAVNDTLGHHIGDLLLKRVSLRLRDVSREVGRISRLGGDEFTLLMPVCRRPDEATGVAQRCIDALSSVFDLAGHEVRVGVSIGIVVSSAPHASVDVVMQQADQAMYKAKREGRNRYRVFEAAMSNPLRWQDDMESDLRRALASEQLQLHYQPILDANSGAITALEALLRWPHPTRGDVSPAEFIPLAEERHLMPELGAWVLRRACRDAAGWPSHIRVSVNVSPLQLLREDFMVLLRDVLRASGLAPERLELEITETTLIGNAEMPRSLLRQARELGVGVAMDDFGIGYSSLDLLQNFPFTRVKIDRSFVHGIGKNTKSIAIVRSIITLCQSLELPVIAEGVETEHQRQVLREEKCSELQGFLFQPAVPLAEIVRSLTDRDADATSWRHESHAGT